MPERALKAGLPICGGWKFCLDGVQGDADFIAAIFNLNRTMAFITSLLI